MFTWGAVPDCDGSATARSARAWVGKNSPEEFRLSPVVPTLLLPGSDATDNVPTNPTSPPDPASNCYPRQPNLSWFRSLESINGEWITNLRYVGAIIPYEEAESFIKHIAAISDWVERSL